MKVKVGVIGLGTVGSGALDLLAQQGRFFSEKLKIDLEVTAVCARTRKSLDKVNLPKVFKTTQALELVARPDVDVVLELVGGCEGPLAWISAALANKKHVVTANKALIAEHGPELFPLAAQNRCLLAFEGAVGGGIPIVKTLQESFIANDIESIACIINGTCNYILSEMASRKASFEDVLQEAQALGYAEADPTLDVSGMDSAHKVAILAALSHRKFVDFREMSVTGISHISNLDMELADQLGFAIKLLGVIKPYPDGRLFAHVYPAILPKSHSLASIHGVVNGIFVQGSAAGAHLLSGPGAGRMPTASSVVGDLIHVCREMRNSLYSEHTVNVMPREEKMALVPIDELVTQYFLRFSIVDRAGAIGEIGTLLAKFGISAHFALAKNFKGQKGNSVIILTQPSREKDVQEALEQIATLPFITEKTQFLRFYE